MFINLVAAFVTTCPTLDYSSNIHQKQNYFQICFLGPTSSLPSSQEVITTCPIIHCSSSIRSRSTSRSVSRPNLSFPSEVHIYCSRHYLPYALNCSVSICSKSSPGCVFSSKLHPITPVQPGSKYLLRSSLRALHWTAAPAYEAEILSGQFLVSTFTLPSSQVSEHSLLRRDNCYAMPSPLSCLEVVIHFPPPPPSLCLYSAPIALPCHASVVRIFYQPCWL